MLTKMFLGISLALLAGFICIPYGSIKAQQSDLLKVHLYTENHRTEYYQGMPILLKVSVGSSLAMEMMNRRTHAALSGKELKDTLPTVTVGTESRPWQQNVRFVVERVSTKSGKTVPQAEVLSEKNWLSSLIPDLVAPQQEIQYQSVRSTWEIEPHVTGSLEPGNYRITAIFDGTAIRELNIGVEVGIVRSEEVVIQLLPRATEKPALAETERQLARYYLTKREYSEAIVHGLRARQHEPEDLNTFLILGEAYERDQKIREAIVEYEQYLQRAPEPTERDPYPAILRDHVEDLKSSLKR